MWWKTRSSSTCNVLLCLFQNKLRANLFASRVVERTFVAYAFINAQNLHVMHVAMAIAFTNKPQFHITHTVFVAFVFINMPHLHTMPTLPAYAILACDIPLLQVLFLMCCFWHILLFILSVGVLHILNRQHLGHCISDWHCMICEL